MWQHYDTPMKHQVKSQSWFDVHYGGEKATHTPLLGAWDALRK